MLVRDAAPPALDSAAYAASVEEVKSLGSATSTTRTADQTQMAQFWADGEHRTTKKGQCKHWPKSQIINVNANLFAFGWDNPGYPTSSASTSSNT